MSSLLFPSSALHENNLCKYYWKSCEVWQYEDSGLRRRDTMLVGYTTEVVIQLTILQTSAIISATFLMYKKEYI
jgi:hypothetical protein